MGETVEQRSGHRCLAEDLAPARELQVAGDQYAPPLIAFGEELEEQGPFLRQVDIPQLVGDDQVQTGIALQQLGKSQFLVGQAQFLGQGSHCGESHLIAGRDHPDADG